MMHETRIIITAATFTIGSIAASASVETPRWPSNLWMLVSLTSFAFGLWILG